MQDNIVLFVLAGTSTFSRKPASTRSRKVYKICEEPSTRLSKLILCESLNPYGQIYPFDRQNYPMTCIKVLMLCFYLHHKYNLAGSS